VDAGRNHSGLGVVVDFRVAVLDPTRVDSTVVAVGALEVMRKTVSKFGCGPLFASVRIIP
jgi:hypothetical protein